MANDDGIGPPVGTHFMGVQCLYSWSLGHSAPKFSHDYPIRLPSTKTRKKRSQPVAKVYYMLVVLRVCIYVKGNVGKSIFENATLTKFFVAKHFPTLISQKPISGL